MHKSVPATAFTSWDHRHPGSRVSRPTWTSPARLTSSSRQFPPSRTSSGPIEGHLLQGLNHYCPLPNPLVLPPRKRTPQEWAWAPGLCHVIRSRAERSHRASRWSVRPRTSRKGQSDTASSVPLPTTFAALAHINSWLARRVLLHRGKIGVASASRGFMDVAAGVGQGDRWPDRPWGAAWTVRRPGSAARHRRPTFGCGGRRRRLQPHARAGTRSRTHSRGRP